MSSLGLNEWLGEGCRIVRKLEYSILSLAVVPISSIEMFCSPFELVIFQTATLLLTAREVVAKPGFDFLWWTDLISAVFLAICKLQGCSKRIYTNLPYLLLQPKSLLSHLHQSCG